MNTPTLITIYLQTTSLADCIADLIALGVLLPPTKMPEMSKSAPASTPQQFTSPTGVMLDYLGQLVATPAVVDSSKFPPTVTKEAVMLPGEFANVYLTPPALPLAEKFTGAVFTHGTVVLPSPAKPRRVLA